MLKASRRWLPTLVLAILVLMAAGPVSRAAAAPKPQTQINVNPRTLNFGTRKRGSVTKLSFGIANLSKTNTLNISIFLPSVPPFVVLQGGGATALAPRGRMMVTVQFAPAFPGKYSGQINVNSNDPVNKSIPITLNGAAK